MVTLYVILLDQLPVGVDVVFPACSDTQVRQVVPRQYVRQRPNPRVKGFGVGRQVDEDATLPKVKGHGIQGEVSLAKSLSAYHVRGGDELAVQIVGPTVVAAGYGAALEFPRRHTAQLVTPVSANVGEGVYDAVLVPDYDDTLVDDVLCYEIAGVRDLGNPPDIQPGVVEDALFFKFVDILGPIVATGQSPPDRGCLFGY